MKPLNQKEEFVFYKDFLKKEIEEIEKNALRVYYTRVSVKNDSRQIVFTISMEKTDDSSKPADILKHICDGNGVNSEGFKYLIGGDGQSIGVGKPNFAGHPCKFEKNQLTIRDCEGMKNLKLPKQGWLWEDITIQVQEKKRQLNAMQKISQHKEVNPTLTYYLFHPEELPINTVHNLMLSKTYQKDAKNNLIRYNDNQVRAIFNALNLSPLSVIQGPPGTGKTTVITEIVFQILANEPQAKILITSQTNNAVDQVLENLIANNIQVARLAGITQPKSKIVAKHTMERKLEGWKQGVRDNAIKYFKTINNLDEEKICLHKEWLDAVASLQEDGSVRERLLRSIRVIGGTCNHVASSKYMAYNFNFDYVIMDESGKATLSESLVPIVMGKKLILVGDHRQLRPMLTTQKKVEYWLRKKYDGGGHEYESFDEYFNRPSLFEMLIERIPAEYKTQLTECRRCSGLTVELTSRSFYEPMGDHPIVSAIKDTHPTTLFPLVTDSSLLFIDIHSDYCSQLDKNGSSFNEHSAKCISDLLLQLGTCQFANQYSYGIISGYKAQYTQLCKSIYKQSQKLNSLMRGQDNFTISVFDRFQGLERDIVIVDLVKSGKNLNLGFLEVPNRINVALSRHKKLLIIVGDYNGLLQAKTHRTNGKPCALQNYLAAIPKHLIIPEENINQLFK